ncbi:unnamed protein product [Brassica oleracea var. botrytis]
MACFYCYWTCQLATSSCWEADSCTQDSDERLLQETLP